MIETRSQLNQMELPIRNNPISENKTCCWVMIGGISLGLIAGLALGIIFGELATLLGFVVGVSGVFLGAIIHSCCISKDDRNGVPEDLPPTPVERAPANWNNLTDEQRAANLDERHIARKTANLALQAKIENLRRR